MRGRGGEGNGRVLLIRRRDVGVRLLLGGGLVLLLKALACTYTDTRLCLIQSI